MLVLLPGRQEGAQKEKKKGYFHLSCFKKEVGVISPDPCPKSGRRAFLKFN